MTHEANASPHAILFTRKFDQHGVVRAIPTPRPDVDSLYKTVVALKEVVDTLTRQSRHNDFENTIHSAVTVQDLLHAGFADLL